MSFKNSYLASVYENVAKRDPDQPEFLQTVKEVLSTIEPVIEQRPDLVAAGVVERMVEPERVPCTVQLCYRSVQGRSPFPSFRKPFHYEVSRI